MSNPDKYLGDANDRICVAMNHARDIIFHLEYGRTALHTAHAQADELRRLLRRCLPYILFIRNEISAPYPGYDDFLSLDELIDLINASAPEPPAPDPAPDHDGDLPDEVPF